MPTAERTTDLTRQFYAWERRGRGHGRHPYPVGLEPPFRFPDWHRRPSPGRDDGRRETLLSRLFRRPAKPPPDIPLVPEAPPEAFAWSGPPGEYALLLPPDSLISPGGSAAWLSSLAPVSAPVVYELLGSGGSVEQRLVCAANDARLLATSLRAVAPGAALIPTNRSLPTLWNGSGGEAQVALEFGLGREFVLPLGGPHTPRANSLASFVSALADLASGEVGILQVMLLPARAPWQDAIRSAVMTPDGRPFFSDAPDVTRLAEQKAAGRPFAAVLRVASRAADPGRAFGVVRGLAGGLAVLGDRGGNELVPLAADDPDELLVDVLTRTTHRTGMVLSADELALLVGLPGDRGEAPALQRLTPSKPAPERLRRSDGILLGENRSEGVSKSVYLPTVDRTRHVHVVGASGVGKSTLLVRSILQDIEAGRGVGVLDVHGDLIDDVLARMPEGRVDDVVVFDPSDTEAVVGWNLLSAEGEAARQVLASDLVSVFRRLSTSWGDQMDAVLSNAVLALLDSPRGGTILDLRRFLVDKPFRDGYLRTARDAHLRSFWETEFPLLVGRRPQAPILTRLDTLLRHRLVREALTVRSRPLDFRAVMSDRRVVLARLAQGAIGRENAALLGSLLLTAFNQAALARQDTPEVERAPYYLYLDEVQELATPSLASIFAEARKFGLCLTVAHQGIYQLRSAAPDVERAVFSNAHTRIVFRVSTDDARALAAGFSAFGPERLTSLSTGEAVCRVGSSLDDFDLSTAPLPGIDAQAARERRLRIVERSRELWGTPREILRETLADDGRVLAVGTALQEGAADVPRRRPDRKGASPVAQDVPLLPKLTEPTAREASPTPAEPTPLPSVATEGRGGPEHRYLQSLIRAWAQDRGFRADLEQELEGGGRVDLALTKGELRVACEVSVTTATGHEIENVRKCITAGFDRVFVVSLKQRFLQSLDKTLAEVLDAEERPRVAAVTPETLLAWLAEEPAREGTVAGYTVRTQVRSPGATEAEARRQRLAEVVGKSARRLQSDGQA